ncbi:MAG TPA: hypothetical protein PLU50_09635, partial [Pseudobdellovibrionaceae bacterium]|nr:hypothetical protein [Pseudobdellovibrionaceae bacterium]
SQIVLETQQRSTHFKPRKDLFLKSIYMICRSKILSAIFNSICMMMIAPVLHAQEQPTPRQVCATANSNICLALTSSSVPNTSDSWVFDLQLTSPAQGSIESISVKLKMKMGSHEHGTDEVQISRVSPRKARVSNVWLVMAGQWFADVQFMVAMPSGQRQAVSLRYPILVP